MIFAILHSLFLGVSPTAYAALDEINGKQQVIASLRISKRDDLDFGEAEQGAPPKTITPGGSGSGSFDVNGEPHRSYSIGYPTEILLRQTGSGHSSISVRNITSNPKEIGRLDRNGYQRLSIGGTRSSLAPNQAPGSYLGTIPVTVIYSL